MRAGDGRAARPRRQVFDFRSPNTDETLVLDMRREKIASLDAVRTFACLSVLGYHMYLVHFGHLGVAMFFMMGGFLSVYNHFGEGGEAVTLRGSVNYAYARISKLYPLYLASLLIPAAGQVYGAVYGLISTKTVLFKFAADALVLQAWVPINEIYFSLNGPAWYLSAVAFCYFAFPWLLRRIERLKSARGALTAAALIWLAQLAVELAGKWLYTRFGCDDVNLRRDFYGWLTYVFPMFRLGDFAVGGCLAYVFLTRGERKGSRAAWTAAELGAVGLAVLAELGFEHGWLPFNDTSAYLVACAAVVYVFAVNRGYISRALTCGVTRYISGISTELFLTHSVVIFACSPILERLPFEFSTKQIIYVITVPIFSWAAALLGKRLNAWVNNRRAKRAA